MVLQACHRNAPSLLLQAPPGKIAGGKGEYRFLIDPERQGQGPLALDLLVTEFERMLVVRLVATSTWNRLNPEADFAYHSGS